MGSSVTEKFFAAQAKTQKEEDSLNQSVIRMAQRMDQLETRIDYLELKLKEGSK